MNKLLRGALWRRHLVAAVALVLLLPLAAPVFAKGPDAVDQTIDRMNLESKARARIVERVSPSVVNIMVVKKISKPSSQRDHLVRLGGRWSPKRARQVGGD